MTIIIYLFAFSFGCMAAALFFAYHRRKHYGLFLMGITYATGAALSVMLTHWWPLLAAFVLAWVLRLMGLDPGPDEKQP